MDLPLGGRRVKVQPVDLGDGCPASGVVSTRVHAWPGERVRDVPHAGGVAVVVRKPRLVGVEPVCPRRAFTPVTEQLSVRARCTTRLKTYFAPAGCLVSLRRRLCVTRGTHDGRHASPRRRGYEPNDHGARIIVRRRP